ARHGFALFYTWCNFASIAAIRRVDGDGEERPRRRSGRGGGRAGAAVPAKAARVGGERPRTRNLRGCARLCRRAGRRAESFVSRRSARKAPESRRFGAAGGGHRTRIRLGGLAPFDQAGRYRL